MRLKAAYIEALCLVGCYLASFLLLGALIGYRIFLHNPLDIQMHNTYFVLHNTVATLPIFLIVALVVTGARTIAEPLRTRYTWAVLLLLGLVVVLVILLIILIANKIIR
jgi:hypothetical protein